MDLRKLKTIIDIFKESGIQEMDFKEGEDRVRLSKTGVAPVMQMQPPSAPAQALPVASSQPESSPPAEVEEKGEKVLSPMVGTFYRASSPETPPFVRLGQTVRAGEVLCIIEAMKLMNEIPSPCTGKITAILVENGSPVGYGIPLFVIE